MAVNYSQATLTARLQAIITRIGTSGTLVLYASGVAIATVTLSTPVGTASVGILDFSGAPITVTAAATGTIDRGVLYNGSGTVAINTLSVGIPLSNEDIEISNGLNSLYVTSGQQVSFLGGEIESIYS